MGAMKTLAKVDKASMTNWVYDTPHAEKLYEAYFAEFVGMFGPAHRIAFGKYNLLFHPLIPKPNVDMFEVFTIDDTISFSPELSAAFDPPTRNKPFDDLCITRT